MQNIKAQTIRIIPSIFFCSLVILQTSCSYRTEEKAGTEHVNRLAQASSPYLKEHSDNPVDWYEWGTEALEKSKNEGKPLIISIGYAACHWCHVMEEESFMDTSVARLMNANFVSIKIDREERPDIDQIYMNAAQLISGNGGWPLNAFALPDGKPFYVATYFPKDQWVKVLHQISEAYKKDNESMVRQAEALTKGIRSHDVITIPDDNQSSYNQKTYQDIFLNWQSYFDYESGGLKGAPKFPMPVVWEFLLQNNYLTGNKKALEAVTISLDEMARGGIYDQVGGGFARYSTDANWKVPHFEKMLYDNGQLVSLYAHAYQVTKNPMYSEVIQETLEFIKSEMTSPEGGFYSSLNADSEGEEGKFYVWIKVEIEKILAKKVADLFVEYYQITDSGNWEDNKNIFYTKTTNKDFALKHLMTIEEWERILDDAENVILNERKKRIRPSLDDKILTSWNALMLNGYIDAYFAIGNPNYLKAALKNASFIEKNLIRQEGQLWRNCKDGKASINAFLDDYALLAKSFIHLYQATYDIHWLERARSICDYTILHFRDKQSGVFYYTSDESQDLIARKMELTDNVIPSSNSVLAEVLYRLGEYYDQDSYREMSKTMLSQVSEDIDKNGPYYANWGSLMGLITYQPYEVAIMGDGALEKTRVMLGHYIPTTLFMGGNQENLPLLEDKYVKGQTIIYVCRNKVCKLPVDDATKALEQLK